MGFAARLTQVERNALKVLEEELDAKREETLRELKRERYGAPTILTEVRCWACNGLLVKNQADWWVHIEAGPCSTPVVSMNEVRA